jgi:hypothetical protein
MIIAQLPALNMTAVSIATVATIQAPQFVTTVGGTPNGLPAGAAYLAVGKGFNFGYSFRVRQAGYIVTGASPVTYTLGFTPLIGPATPAASPTLIATFNAAASAAQTASQTVNFELSYTLSVDGNSQTLGGFSIGNVKGALLAATGAGPLTGFTLPASKTPYSWPLPITGVDQNITNAPFVYFVPQVTASGTSVGSTVTWLSFEVEQG